MNNTRSFIIIFFLIGLIACQDKDLGIDKSNTYGITKTGITNKDSLWFKLKDKLTINNYKNKEFLLFKKNSQAYLNKAIKLNSPKHMAKGYYKLGSYFFKKEVYDSAFYFFNHSKNIFIQRKDSTDIIANLLNMAIIQNRVYDFNGSEETSIEALKYINHSTNHKYWIGVNNNLGIISNELGLYKEAIRWYTKSLKSTSTIKQKITLQNNIGIVLRNQKKYLDALAYFQKALRNPEINKHPLLKAMVIDNIGYVYFLMEDRHGLTNLEVAYKIRKKGNQQRGIIVSLLHLGEYYFSKKNNKTASVFLLEALNKSKQINDTKNKLKALLFLSKLNSSNQYIYQYSALNEEILKKERNYKHQFAKIKYRTKEQEEKNIKLEQLVGDQKHALVLQEHKKLILGVISLSLLTLLMGAVFYYRQKQRIQKQQLIIEKLKARNDEKQIISMHLHDDIASDILIGLQQADILQSKISNNELEKIITFIDRAYSKMRNISQELSTLNFKKVSFENKVDILCNEYGFKADLKIIHSGLKDIDWNTFSDEIKSALYGTIQEALNNIIKHANASITIINFKRNQNKLYIYIKDNGIGYDKVAVEGIGLLHIKKRIQEMDGTFKIQKTQPKGTILEIIIPII